MYSSFKNISLHLWPHLFCEPVAILYLSFGRKCGSRHRKHNVTVLALVGEFLGLVSKTLGWLLRRRGVIQHSKQVLFLLSLRVVIDCYWCTLVDLGHYISMTRCLSLKLTTPWLYDLTTQTGCISVYPDSYNIRTVCVKL